MTYDVFISYAHQDSDTVNSIINHLRSKNFKFAWDEDHILPGQKYRREEETLVNQSHKFLLVHSKNIYRNGEIRKEVKVELEFARNAHKPIIPLAIDKTRLKPAIQDYLGTGNEGTSVLFVKGRIEDYYPKLDAALNYGIERVEDIIDENNANFSNLQQSANEGDTTSQLDMGDYFRYGKTIQIDYTAAIRWYKKAAGYDERAYAKLGECYLADLMAFLKRDCLLGFNRTFFEGFLPEIIIKAKASENWFRKAALGSKRDPSGLLDLFEKKMWSYRGLPIFQLLPDDESFEVFEDIPASPQFPLSYRMCRMLYNFTEIYGITWDDSEDAPYMDSSGFIHGTFFVVSEVCTIAKRSISLLQKWSTVGNIDAMLFLAATYYHLRPESCDNYTYQEYHSPQKALELVNKAYKQIGDSLFRYRLSDYDIRDSKDTVGVQWSDALLGQPTPNLIGVQVAMDALPADLAMWETIIPYYCENITKSYYYLGLGSLRVNMSFSAMWLTMSSKRGHLAATRLLGDYYAQRLVVYDGGKERKTGAIDNVIFQLEKGASSGDHSLDYSAKSKDGNDIRRMPKSSFISLFLKYVSKAANLYRNYGDKKNGDKENVDLGWCYYWNLGVPPDSRNREFAQSLGYTPALADLDEPDLKPWLDARDEKLRLIQEVEDLAELGSYYEDDDELFVKQSSNAMSEDIDFEWLNKRAEECRKRSEEWKANFPDIPCPYDYLINIYKVS